jgi:hypothetical protein
MTKKNEGKSKIDGNRNDNRNRNRNDNFNYDSKDNSRSLRDDKQNYQ